MAASFSVSEFVRSSPDVVFAAMTDLDGWKSWMPGLVRVDTLTEGPFAVGTTWREIRKMFGKEGVEEFEVTFLDPPRSIQLHVDGSKGTTGRGEYQFEHTFEAESDGTRVTLTGVVHMPGIMFRLLGGILTRTLKGAVAKDLAAFKAYVESNGARTDAPG